MLDLFPKNVQHPMNSIEHNGISYIIALLRQIHVNSHSILIHIYIKCLSSILCYFIAISFQKEKLYINCHAFSQICLVKHMNGNSRLFLEFQDMAQLSFVDSCQQEIITIFLFHKSQVCWMSSVILWHRCIIDLSEKSSKSTPLIWIQDILFLLYNSRSILFFLLSTFPHL